MMIRGFSFVLLFTLLLLSCASGQSLLWQIEGNGLSKPSFLFGTIHAICPDQVVMPENIQHVMDSCDQLALEIDLDDERLIVEMGKISLLPEDSTLADVFGEDYARVNSWMADSAGIALDMLGNLRPMFLVGLLIGKVIDCSPTSYEQLFMAMAQRQGKDVIGLETPAEQLSAFSVISLQDQAEMVIQIIDNIDSTRIEFTRLADLYRSQDLTGLRQLLLNSDIEYGRYQESLLKKRNQNWLPRIEGLAKAMPTLFAVGAGHLPGEDGLLQLLKSKGYRVTPVN